MLFRGVSLLCLVCTMLLIGIGSHPAPGAWFEDIDDSVHIVFPERLNKGRLRRDLSTKSKNSSDEYVSFKLKAFGKDMVVDIHLNKMLATPQFTLRYFKSNGELVQREEATPKCQYQGYVRGQETESAVILETCHGLSGLIEDKENRLYIEPYPVKGKGAHKVYKTKNGKWKQFSCGEK
ncbi:disintegrin and metalloproteinase domain-containing protein 28-like [Montipora capricornis]|uniref:disintegrin and metalloproteinase domain-containing protein 28-like n=1 Tax=Montipora capricornis TaxID=246305 RepID=UPI0035F1AE68